MTKLSLIIPVYNEEKSLKSIVDRTLSIQKDLEDVELELVTGRTHQIRVHTSYKKHPVYNDTLYGAGEGKVKTQEQVLQSFYLKFAKPFSSTIIELEIEPDEKLSKVLTYFRNRNI